VQIIEQKKVRQQRCLERDDVVLPAFIAGKGRPGSPRLVLDLTDDGHACDLKTVANSMVRRGLCAKAGRKLKATTNWKHGLPVANNMLQRNFSASKTVWCFHNMIADPVGNALTMALRKRRMPTTE